MTLTHPRPRLDTSKPRRAPGIVLTDVPDQEIIALLDAGLSRIEIGRHFGVADHIIRYRIRVMRDRKILPETDLPYGRFFIDYLYDFTNGDDLYFQIPAHRRNAWGAFKSKYLGGRMEPAWAIELVDFWLLEFSAPRSFGAYAKSGQTLQEVAGIPTVPAINKAA
nr:hypothetical protein [uncultured Devosia sp.]